jgi:hypothetical protein
MAMRLLPHGARDASSEATLSLELLLVDFHRASRRFGGLNICGIGEEPGSSKRPYRERVD